LADTSKQPDSTKLTSPVLSHAIVMIGYLTFSRQLSIESENPIEFELLYIPILYP